MKIAAIIVAAGQSSRFGDGNKLLAAVNGKPLIRHAVEAAVLSQLDDVVVVTRAGAAELLAAAGDGNWRSVVNDKPEGGLSSSIQCGLAMLDPSTDGALVLLADMPRVTRTHIMQLCSAFAANNGLAIVYPQSSEGRQGNPVLWPRNLFDDLMQLRGDVGGKAILRAHPELHHPVIIADDGIFADIDKASDIVSSAPIGR